MSLLYLYIRSCKRSGKIYRKYPEVIPNAASRMRTIFVQRMGTVILCSYSFELVSSWIEQARPKAVKNPKSSNMVPVWILLSRVPRLSMYIHDWTELFSDVSSEGKWNTQWYIDFAISTGTWWKYWNVGRNQFSVVRMRSTRYCVLINNNRDGSIARCLISKIPPKA